MTQADLFAALVMLEWRKSTFSDVLYLPPESEGREVVSVDGDTRDPDDATSIKLPDDQVELELFVGRPDSTYRRLIVTCQEALEMIAHDTATKPA